MKKVFGLVAVLISLNLNSSDLLDLDYDVWAKDLQTLIELNGAIEDSIEGSDKNGNLVRDDVENYIKKKYEGDEFQKIMFLEAAKKIQQILTLPKNSPKNIHKRLDNELLQIYTCRDYILYKHDDVDVEKEIEAKSEFKSVVLNTAERVEAYIEHKKLLPFKYSLPSDKELKKQKSACERLYSRIQSENKKSRTLSAK